MACRTQQSAVSAFHSLLFPRFYKSSKHCPFVIVHSYFIKPLFITMYVWVRGNVRSTVTEEREMICFFWGAFLWFLSNSWTPEESSFLLQKKKTVVTWGISTKDELSKCRGKICLYVFLTFLNPGKIWWVCTILSSNALCLLILCMQMRWIVQRLSFAVGIWITVTFRELRYCSWGFLWHQVTSSHSFFLEGGYFTALNHLPLRMKINFSSL